MREKIFFLIFITIVLLSSCGNTNNIIGTWKSENDSIVIIFNHDSTYMATIKPYTIATPNENSDSVIQIKGRWKLYNYESSISNRIKCLRFPVYEIELGMSPLTPMYRLYYNFDTMYMIYGEQGKHRFLEKLI